MIWNLWFSLLLLTGTAFAAVENIDTFNDGTTPVVNENFRTLNDNVNKATTNVAALTAYFTNGILGTTYGGNSANLSACTKGSIPYFSSTGVMTCLAPATSGDTLQSGGAGINPFFSAPTPQGFDLISVTTISGAATTGNISLTNGNTYFVQYSFVALSAADVLALRFNGDSGAGHYRYVNIGSTTTGAVTALSASSNFIQVGTSVNNNTNLGINGNFIINQTGTSSQVYNIWGQLIEDESAGGLMAMFNHSGRWSNSDNMTSFVLYTTGGATMTGTVYLYKLRKS